MLKTMQKNFEEHSNNNAELQNNAEPQNSA